MLLYYSICHVHCRKRALRRIRFVLPNAAFESGVDRAAQLALEMLIPNEDEM